MLAHAQSDCVVIKVAFVNNKEGRTGKGKWKGVKGEGKGFVLVISECWHACYSHDLLKIGYAAIII